MERRYQYNGVYVSQSIPLTTLAGSCNCCRRHQNRKCLLRKQTGELPGPSPTQEEIISAPKESELPSIRDPGYDGCRHLNLAALIDWEQRGFTPSSGNI